jgi:hypothetical protein
LSLERIERVKRREQVRVWRREARLEKVGASFKEGGTLVHEGFMEEGAHT